MHLIALVCCIGCLALTGAVQSDINTKETGQLVLALKETHNDGNDLEKPSPTNQNSNFGWAPAGNDQTKRAQVDNPAAKAHSFGWTSPEAGVKSVQKRQTLYPFSDLAWNAGANYENQPQNAPAPRLQYFGVAPQYQKFVNETLSRVSSGLCQKEVPTASLYGSNVNVPRGNGSNPALSRVQVCCQGYQRNEHIFKKCDPICENGCTNGVCAGPNDCICYPDHVKNLAGFCVSTCPNGCENGDCNGNTCVCKDRYTLDRSSKFCVPHCDPACGKGKCIAPNKCLCNDGYETNSRGTCVPKCPQGCELGECVAPGQCSCRAGFKLLNDKCTPFCERGCVDGDCVAPNTCVCTGGFNLDPSGTRCEAKCDQPCLNGRCDGPNRCRCNSGYQLDEYDPFKCVAHCPAGCVNGVCSSPGLCLCNAGFVKDRSKKGSQECIPRT